MAIQVRRPAQQTGGLEKGVAVGSIVGGAIAGQPLAVAGGVQSLRGQAQRAGQVQQEPMTAMERRMTGVNDDIMQQMRIMQQAEQIIPELPPEVRQEVAPTIFQTMARMAQQIKQRRA